MWDAVFEELTGRGISVGEPIPLAECRILRPYKLTRLGFADSDRLTVIMLAVPYLAECERGNLSSYAVPRDYHLYFRSLFDGLIPYLKSQYPEYRFCGFADDSPIDERDAAAKARLGIIGKNGMLITKKHSSYVFLCKIITDLPFQGAAAHPIEYCEDCGLCTSACTALRAEGQCLSSLTQKKGELSPAEEKMIGDSGVIWGCDRCQEVCPHTKRARRDGTIYTTVDFFKENLIPNLTESVLREMSDEDFASRAYSWRGKSVIERNLRLLSTPHHNNAKE
jgi:epoxyqueuosine reductase QueG